MIKAKAKLKLENFNSLKRNMDFLNKNHAEIGVYGGGDLVIIATVHEYGNKVNPPRSFLRLPMILHKKEIFKLFTSSFEKLKYKKDGGKEILLKIAIFAESLSQEAFATGGFGHWKSLLPATILAKGTGTILIHTGELRRAVRGTVASNK